MSADGPSTTSIDAAWFPVPTPDQPDALDTWAHDVAAYWAKAVDADAAGSDAFGEAVRTLGLTYFDPSAPIRAFWLLPGTTGVMFDFTARSATDGPSWSDDQRRIVDEYCADAVATEWLVSDAPGVPATIALSTYDDPDGDTDAFGNTGGVAQIVAVVRRETPQGVIDLVARAIDGDAELIEMSAYAVISLLYGDDDLLAAVTRSLYSSSTGGK